jgi:hypothetical protein
MGEWMYRSTSRSLIVQVVDAFYIRVLRLFSDVEKLWSSSQVSGNLPLIEKVNKT